MTTDFAIPYRPEVHGHRGCRGLLPENTLPGFLHALALGVDVLEMDVVVSADHRVVVSHEPWLNPSICLSPNHETIARISPPQFNLYRMPYDTIRQCDAGQLVHPSFPLQSPLPAHKPLLSEVLETVAIATQQSGRSPVRFSVEIKSSPQGDKLYHPEPAVFLDLVLADLYAARVLSRTTLLSFDARILQLVRERHADVATCLLIEKEQPWISSIKALGFQPTTFGPEYSTVTIASVQNLRSTFPGLRIVPWTVNTVAEMHVLLKLGVEGITTDFPNVLMSLL